MLKRNVLILGIIMIILNSIIPYIITICNNFTQLSTSKYDIGYQILYQINDNKICMDNSLSITLSNNLMINSTTIFKDVSVIISIIAGIKLTNYILLTDEQKENLLQDTRFKIYDLIQKNEGIHLREICRLLNKKMGVIQYHIQVLEKSGLIVSIKDGRYRRFFTNVKELKDYSNKIIVSMTRRETTMKLLEQIYKNNGTGIYHKQLAEQIGISSQAITWHIKRLINENIIRSVKVGRQKKYFIVDEHLDLIKQIFSKTN